MSLVPESGNDVPVATIDNELHSNGDNFQLNQEQEAQKYVEWQQHRAKESPWNQAYDTLSHLLPGWFLLSSLIVGAITLGLVMLKVNPLLAPVKNTVIWLLKFWESFLESSKNIIGKK